MGQAYKSLGGTKMTILRNKRLFSWIVIFMIIIMQFKMPVQVNASTPEITVSTFEELKTAIEASNNVDPTTIKLNNDISYDSNLVITDKKIIFDLNGHSYTYVYDVYTGLELRGTSSLEVLDTATTGVFASRISCYDTAVLTISGGTITSTLTNLDDGTINISGGTITGTVVNGSGNFSLVTNSTVNITGGTVASSDKTLLTNLQGRMIISGGIVSSTSKISAYPIDFYGGSLEISGGSVSSLYNYAIYANSGGSIAISGGLITSENAVALNIGGTVKATISGGTISSNSTKGHMAITEDSGSGPTSIQLIISGGTIFAESSYAIWAITGSLIDISGGTISTNSKGFSSTSSIYIEKCKVVNISGGNLGVVNLGALPNPLNLSGNPKVTIQLASYMFVNHPFSITGPLTGEDGAIVLDAKYFQTMSKGLVVANAITDSDAVVSKFSLTNIAGKSLIKDGSNIVVSGLGTVTGITLSKTKVNIIQGKSLTLTASVSGTGGYTDSVTWSSNNSKVTVDNGGKVTVASDAPIGDYIITVASVYDTSKTATITVTATSSTAALPDTGVTGSVASVLLLMGLVLLGLSKPTLNK